MKNNRIEYKQRLIKVLKESGARNKDFIQQCGVTNGAVSHWRSEDGTVPTDLICFAKVVGWDPDELKIYLETGKISSEHRTNLIADKEGFYHTGKIQNNYQMVPVVGMARLGDNGFFEEQQYPVGHGDGYIDTPTKDKNAYSLKVVGDSMYPAIRHGWYVVIEPNLDVYNGMLALFKFRDGRKMIKELANYSDGFYTLLSVNQDHKRITASQEEIEDIHAVAFIAPPHKVRQP